MLLYAGILIGFLVGAIIGFVVGRKTGRRNYLQISGNNVKQTQITQINCSSFQERGTDD